LIAGVFLAANLAQLFRSVGGHGISYRPFQNTAVVIGGTMFVAVCTEALLGWQEQRAALRSSLVVSNPGGVDIKTNLMGAALQPQALVNMARREGVLTFPLEWEQQEMSPLPGTRRTYRWHGVVHVYDENNFRRATPFPLKRPGVFRIMVVGDSLTFGQGIDERFIYTSLLQDELGKQYAIEVLNLAVPGYQSEDILMVIKQFVPALQPDLVVYGVCLNDFLPSKRGQYTARGFEFPVPAGLERFLHDRTRLARVLADLYDRSLRVAGLRVDFFDDILKDFEGYQQRFRHDASEMNTFVTTRGLPPVVAMVLDQYPNLVGRGHKIAQAAEGYLKETGMEVIETEEYYQRLNGHAMAVSLWEGHPNEEAHAIYSSMIEKKLRAHPALQPFKRISLE
jgi:hypothetical protein